MENDLPLVQPEPEAQPVLEREIGGFWRRLIAFLLDGLALGVIGVLIAAPFFNAFADLGAWGRLVGFLIAVAYFGVQDSAIGGGRSLGKRLLGLQVVKADGSLLALEESLLRAMIFAMPWFLNGLSLPVSRTSLVTMTLLGLAVFGVGGANLYLLIFNRATRQGLHDFAVKSYVTMLAAEGEVASRRVWKAHLWIAGALMAAVGMGGAILGSTAAKLGPLPQLLRDAAAVERMNEVQAAGAHANWTRQLGSGKTTSTLAINAQLKVRPNDWEASADQVARRVLEADPTVDSYDYVRVQVVRGYDIGIASGWSGNWYAHSPAEWRALLYGSAPGLQAH